MQKETKVVDYTARTSTFHPPAAGQQKGKKAGADHSITQPDTFQPPRGMFEKDQRNLFDYERPTSTVPFPQRNKIEVPKNRVKREAFPSSSQKDTFLSPEGRRRGKPSTSLLQRSPILEKSFQLPGPIKQKRNVSLAELSSETDYPQINRKVYINLYYKGSHANRSIVHKNNSNSWS